MAKHTFLQTNRDLVVKQNLIVFNMLLRTYKHFFGFKIPYFLPAPVIYC